MNEFLENIALIMLIAIVLSALTGLGAVAGAIVGTVFF